MYRRNIVTQISIGELKRLSYVLDNDLTPHEFAERYQEHFPVLMKVSVGYCGQNAVDFTFSSDEVYLTTHVLIQERVLLRDTRDQVLSFPVDHRLQFYTIIDGVRSEKPAKLQEILKSDAIGMTSATVFLDPVDVPERTINFCVGPDKTVKLAMEVMELIESYDERYLVGNSITHEVLHFQPFIIPLWMPINLNIADGIKDCPEKDFKELMERLTILCRDFKNSSAPGNKEIMLFQADINDYEGAYDLIQPTNSEYQALPQSRPSAQNTAVLKHPDEPGPKPLPRQPINRPRPSPEKPVKDDKSKPKGIFNQLFAKTKNTKKEELDLGGYQVAQHNTTAMAYSDTPTGSNLRSTKPNTYVKSGNCTRNSDDGIDIPYTPTKKTIEYPAQPVKKPVSQEEEEKNSSDEECYEVFDPNDNNDNKRRSLPPIPGETKPGPNITSRSAIENNNAANWPKPPTPLTAPKPATKPPVMPKTSGRVVPVAAPKEDDDPEYVSYNEIPQTLKGMTVKQVADCLKILNMEEFIGTFEEEDIDGELLSELDEDGLRALGFNGFQVKKMTKFKNGWRPRRN